MKKPSVTSDRQLKLTLLQRVCLGGLLSRQTGDKISVMIGRKATDDDLSAVYDIVCKVRCQPEEILPFQRRIGADTLLDLDKVAKEGTSVIVAFDGHQRRLICTFLTAWLRTEGSMGDRDWALSITQELAD